MAKKETGRPFTKHQQFGLFSMREKCLEGNDPSIIKLYNRRNQGKEEQTME